MKYFFILFFTSLLSFSQDILKFDKEFEFLSFGYYLQPENNAKFKSLKNQISVKYESFNRYDSIHSSYNRKGKLIRERFIAFPQIDTVFYGNNDQIAQYCEIAPNITFQQIDENTYSLIDFDINRKSNHSHNELTIYKKKIIDQYVLFNTKTIYNFKNDSTLTFNYLENDTLKGNGKYVLTENYKEKVKYNFNSTDTIYTKIKKKYKNEKLTYFSEVDYDKMFGLTKLEIKKEYKNNKLYSKKERQEKRYDSFPYYRESKTNSLIFYDEKERDSIEVYSSFKDENTKTSKIKENKKFNCKFIVEEVENEIVEYKLCIDENGKESKEKVYESDDDFYDDNSSLVDEKYDVLSLKEYDNIVEIIEENDINNKVTSKKGYDFSEKLVVEIKLKYNSKNQLILLEKFEENNLKEKIIYEYYE